MKHKKGVHCDRKVEQKVSLVIDVNEIQKLKKNLRIIIIEQVQVLLL